MIAVLYGDDTSASKSHPHLSLLAVVWVFLADPIGQLATTCLAPAIEEHDNRVVVSVRLQTFEKVVHLLCPFHRMPWRTPAVDSQKYIRRKRMLAAGSASPTCEIWSI